MTATRSFTFDWQAAPEGFLKWMLTCLVRDHDIEGLGEATDKFTKCELTIQVNGVPVNAENFIEGVERNMDYYTEREAKKLVASLPRLDKIRDDLEDAERAMRGALREGLAQAGIHMEEDDWRETY